MKTVAEVLESAATQIETYGWLQGSLVGDSADDAPLSQRSCCTLGAIAVASGIFTAQPHALELERAALVAVRAELEKRDWPFTIPSWNDAPGRTAADATGLLRAAAVNAR